MNITLDDGHTELWQWDTGRKIVVDDKSVSEVHYSKYSSTQAITREVINGKAEIPNYLLQDTHAVTVYAYSGSIENRYTMAEKTFNVAKKPKPANYVETEEDKAILAKLKAEIGDLSELQTEVKDNLVSAINEAAASGGGTSDFVVNASLDDNNSCTVDKTYAQIQEAVQAGKKPVVYFAPSDGESYTLDLFMSGESYILDLFMSSDGAYAFAGSAAIMLGITAQITVSIQSSNKVFYDMSFALSVSGDGTIEQVRMSKGPVEPMEIATKKYVDDKEFILQSTTPNSTKKFKITVDDAGTLSAVEVTT